MLRIPVVHLVGRTRARGTSTSCCSPVSTLLKRRSTSTIAPRLFFLSKQQQQQQQQQQQHSRWFSGIASKEEAAQKAAYNFYASRNKPGFWSRLFGKKKKTGSAEGSSTITNQQRNINTAWYALAVAVGALGASYAAVPLYKVFCQTTGFGGTTQRVLTTDGAEQMNALEQYLQRGISAILPEGSTARVHTWTDADAADRLKTLKPVKDAELITIRFDTTVTDVMPWSFEPVQLDVKVVPGETALSFFRVTNHSDKAITGVATYNVHPSKVGLYFQKIQCFCFEEQRLLPGETVDMPVFFFIDPEMLKDRQVSYVRNVTLSYTFFPTDEDDDVDDDDDAEEVKAV